MKKGDFTYLLKEPGKISTMAVSDIRSIIDEFPYFQPARALYLKGLKESESFKYNQELKTTAAYTTDRSVLFDFITSEEFNQNSISDQIRQNFENLKLIEVHDYEEIQKDQNLKIDQALKSYIQENDADLRFEPVSAEGNQEEPITDNIIPKSEPETILEIGKPLEFDKSERHSFSEWLKITSFKPIIREDENLPVDNDTKQRKSKIIDKFIETNPSISPLRDDVPKTNLAKQQMLKPESLMTETLARIYLEQKNYDKAIQAYHILSLKYPEKSGFFADQIQAIKDLKDQKQ